MRAATWACHTHTGRKIWYTGDACETEIVPADLRTQLARTYRYRGAIDWTVLGHLTLCVKMAQTAKLDPVTTAYIAAHDLHEAYVGDIPPPLKYRLDSAGSGWNLDHLDGACAWAELELEWERHVHLSIGLPWPVPETIAAAVRKIDRAAVAIEIWSVHAPAELRAAVERPGEWEIRLGRLSQISAPGQWERVWGAIQAGVSAIKEGT